MAKSEPNTEQIKKLAEHYELAYKLILAKSSDAIKAKVLLAKTNAKMQDDREVARFAKEVILLAEQDDK